MKFSIILSELSKQLQEVSSIAGISPGKDDITQNIYISVKDNLLELKATDYNIELIAKIPLTDVSSEGAIIMNASKLREALKNIDPRTSVSFELDASNQKLILSADSTTFEIRTRSADDFPKFETEDIVQSIVLKQNQLKSLLDKSLFCVAPEDFRDYLKGVRFEVNGTTLSVFTSDGHRMAILETQIESPVNEFFGAILTKRGASQLSKIISANSDAEIVLSFTKNSMTTSCNGYSLSSKLIVCAYPNVRALIPRDVIASIKIPRQELCSYIKRVSVLSSKRVNGVTFTFNNNAVDLHCENSEHEVATAKMQLPYQGEQLEISLNSTYVVEILNIIDCNNVNFCFSSIMSGILIDPDLDVDDAGIKYRYIVSKVVI